MIASKLPNDIGDIFYADYSVSEMEEVDFFL